MHFGKHFRLLVWGNSRQKYVRTETFRRFGMHHFQKKKNIAFGAQLCVIWQARCEYVFQLNSRLLKQECAQKPSRRRKSVGQNDFTESQFAIRNSHTLITFGRWNAHLYNSLRLALNSNAILFERSLLWLTYNFVLCAIENSIAKKGQTTKLSIFIRMLITQICLQNARENNNATHN